MKREESHDFNGEHPKCNDDNPGIEAVSEWLGVSNGMLVFTFGSCIPHQGPRLPSYTIWADSTVSPCRQLPLDGKLG